MRIARLVTLAVIAALTVTLLHADTPPKSDRIDAVINSMLSARSYVVSISPDGRSVAYSVSLNGPAGVPSGSSAIYVTDVAGAQRTRVSAARTAVDNLDEGRFAWSPDSGTLAFISGPLRGQAQIYLASAPKWNAKKLTAAKGYLSSPHFSPDGKTIAVLVVENSSSAIGAVKPTSPDLGLIGDEVVEQRLAIVDATNGVMRFVTPADMHVYSYDWSRDSRQLAAIAAKGSGTNNYWTAQLYTVDAASGAMKSIHAPKAQIADPRWSPDGKSVLLIQGLMSDEGVTGGEIYRVPVDGGDAKSLTPGLRATVLSLRVASGSLIYTQLADDRFEIVAMPLDRSGPSRVLSSEESALSTGHWLGISLADDGRTGATVRSSYAHPPEVWAGPVGGWKQITHDNEGLTPAWGGATSLHWTNDGMRMQGWLLAPAKPSPAGKSPMVVIVHGGPASAKTSSWPGSYAAALPAQGYYVFFPNPRGSFGQGEDFKKANVRDFGYGDLRDILAGVDEVVRTAPIDETRIGIGGGSYGGFMSMWAVTQTNRFRAAVADAGISNWLSYYGENAIDQWMIPFFGASVYDDPYIYARSSPMNFIKNVKTPTLVMVGERDAECPAPQSFEFHRALKRLGVPTEMVVFAGEGHAIETPEHRREMSRRMVDWFDRYLGK